MFDFTIMVYMAGDNSLDGAVIPDINDMELGSPKRSDNFRVVIQADRGIDASPEEPWKGAIRCPLWRPEHVAKGKISTPEEERTYLNDVNMASPDTMKEFVRYSVSKYPAKRYMLILWSHGYNVDDEKAIDPVSEMEEIVTSKGIESLDISISASLQNLFLSWLKKDLLVKGVIEDTKGTMSNPSLSECLSDIASMLPKKKLDFLVFDACSMSSIEIAYQVRNSAKIMIASENSVPNKGLPKQKIFDFIRNIDWSNEDEIKSLESIARTIVREYNFSYSTDFTICHYFTLSAIRLDLIERLAISVDLLAKSLIDSISKDQNAINEIKNLSPESFSKKYFIDLGHFAQLLVSSPLLDASTKDFAHCVYDGLNLRNSDSLIIDEVHAAGCDTPSGFKKGKPNSSGLTIFFPGIDRPEFVIGYSSLGFMKWSWDEFIKSLFGREPLLEPILNFEPPGDGLKLGESKRVSIKLKNKEDLSTTPSELTIKLDVRGKITKEMMIISPLEGVTILYDSTTKKFMPPEAVFQISFHENSLPIPYVIDISVSSKGKNLNIVKEKSYFPLDLINS